MAIKSDMKILAIIPARAGSKRLPGKNSKVLGGKPLIAWSIAAAKNCTLITEVIVSTDSPKIANISRKHGALVPFLRSKKLATDQATSNDVILDVMEYCERQGICFDAIALLQPTSPLRTSSHLKEAIQLFTLKKADTVVSVKKADHPARWTNYIPSTLSMSHFLLPEKRKSGMEVTLNGAIYLAKWDFFKRTQNWFAGKSYAFVMDSRASVDIDTLDDFLLAQVILKTRKI